MQGRHTEFFGPDFARGPFGSSNLQVTAMQIATAIAQLRAPVDRSADAITAHADYVRSLAERLVPEMATFVSTSITAGAFGLTTTFRANYPSRVLLRVWLADSEGGGETNNAPDYVDWVSGTVLEEVTPKKQYVITTDNAGVAAVTIDNAAAATWYWGVVRSAAVFYAGPLTF